MTTLTEEPPCRKWAFCKRVVRICFQRSLRAAEFQLFTPRGSMRAWAAFGPRIHFPQPRSYQNALVGRSIVGKSGRLSGIWRNGILRAKFNFLDPTGFFAYRPCCSQHRAWKRQTKQVMWLTKTIFDGQRTWWTKRQAFVVDSGVTKDYPYRPERPVMREVGCGCGCGVDARYHMNRNPQYFSSN